MSWHKSRPTTVRGFWDTLYLFKRIMLNAVLILFNIADPDTLVYSLHLSITLDSHLIIIVCCKKKKKDLYCFVKNEIGAVNCRRLHLHLV